MAMQVKDLTIDRLKTIIRETVQETLVTIVAELQSRPMSSPLSAEARAIERLTSLDDPTKWITTIVAGEEIDETALNDWLTHRGDPIHCLPTGLPHLRIAIA
jgi:hypothetical protein